jgi:hypothetical protein
MRGRNRGSKGPNPLTRSYESNGPDVKVRGTAQHIAEKYSQLARDAQSSGDPVAAENYLQHAEHYYRIILTAQEQLRQQYGTTFQRPFDDEDEGDEEGFNGGFAPERSMPGFAGGSDEMDPGSQPQPYAGGYDARGGEERRERFDRGPRGDRPERNDRQERGDRQDRGERQDRNDRGDRQDRGPRDDRGEARFDRGPRPERQERNDRPERGERQGGDRPVNDRQDRRERFRDRDREQPRGEFQPREPRPERVEAPEGEVPAPRREERRDERPRRERRPEVVEETGSAALPAFLTNPVRQAPAEAPEPAAAPPAAEAEPAAEAPRPRRRRRTRVEEVPEAGAESRDPTLAE